MCPSDVAYAVTLLLQVPQTIPVIRYVFGFVCEIITCRIHISLRSLHRVQYVRLLLFYSVIFQSCLQIQLSRNKADLLLTLPSVCLTTVLLNWLSVPAAV